MDYNTIFVGMDVHKEKLYDWEVGNFFASFLF